MKNPLIRIARPSVRHEHGFSLVELMIALVVFAIGILTLAAVIPLGVRKSNAASQQTNASELAARCAEQALVTPFDSLTACVHDDPGNPYSGKYYVRWTIEDNRPVTNCKRITVTVHLRSTSNPPTARLVVVSPMSD